MKPQQDDQPNYPPPPGYSPPGQEPPLQAGHKEMGYSAPPPGMHSPGNPQQPIIIYSNTTVAPSQFGPYPMRYTCPHCDAHVMTETYSTPGLLTYILAGALCLLIPCCCPVPCCVRECKDVEHRCPNCQNRLGLFKRI